MLEQIFESEESMASSSRVALDGLEVLHEGRQLQLIVIVTHSGDGR